MDHFAELMLLVQDGWRVELDKDSPPNAVTVRFTYRGGQVMSGFFIERCSQEAFNEECKRHFEDMVNGGNFRKGVEMARARFGDTWGLCYNSCERSL